MQKKISIVVIMAFLVSLFATMPVVAAEIAGLEVTVPQTTIAAGDTLQVTATLHYTDGSSLDVTGQVDWQSQDEGVAVVDDAGLITAQAQGDAIIDAIYTAPDMTVYSDQVQVTVGSPVEVPYSVDFYPADGLLEPYEPILMQFPCEVEITQEYANPIKDYGRSYYLYQDTDKTKVYIKQVPHVEYQALFPETGQLPWPKISARFNNLTDSFKNHIKPVNGTWTYSGYLLPYDFEAKEALPLELLGVYPQNNGTYDLLVTGNSGYTNSLIVSPDGYIKNLPVIFLFNQPVNSGDITQFTINSISPINTVSGNWTDYRYPGTSTLWSYMVQPSAIYNYAVYGPELTDIQATFSLEPGALKLATSGELTDNTYSTTFTVNPTASLYQEGTITGNPALPTTTPPFLQGKITKAWEFDYNSHPYAKKHTPGSGLLFQDIIVFGGENCIYAVIKETGDLAWKIDSSIESDHYEMLPVELNGILYCIDYSIEDETNHYIPILMAVNQDGTIRYTRKIPAMSNKPDAYLQALPNGNISVAYSSIDTQLLSNSFYFEAVFTPDGILESCTDIPQINKPAQPNPFAGYYDSVLPTHTWYWDINLQTTALRDMSLPLYTDNTGNTYYNNGYYVDSSGVKRLIFEDYEGDEAADVCTDRKATLIGKDGLGNNIYMYHKYFEEPNPNSPWSSWLVSKYYFGGDNWVSEDVLFDEFSVVLQSFLGSLIIDTPNGLIKLTTTETPVIPEPEAPTPPVTPPDKPSNPGGGSTTPTPEPPVEPEPEPEPPVAPPVVEPEPEKPELPEIITPAPEPSNPIAVNKPVPQPEPVVTPAPTGTVKGYLKMRDGRPLGNARLELHSTPRVTYTDVNGYFEFQDVPLGDHKLYLADLSIADEKILIKSLQVALQDGLRYIPITAKVKDLEAAQITLQESDLEKEIVMIVDYELPQQKAPIWPWLLLLLLLLIPIRRRRKQQENN